MKHIHTVLLAACLPCFTISAHAEPAPNPDQRAIDSLAQMTVDEKISLLLGYLPFDLKPADQPRPLGAGYVRGVPRLNIPPLIESDASLGVANMGGFMRRGDVATALPSATTLAASFDPALAERAGAMIGGEARAKGFNVLLAGGVNLIREPRNGRNFEYYSEDPLLSGILAGHSIRGVQSNRILSTIKHFALNAQETGRTVLSANMGEAALRETDLLAFQIGIEIGNPGSVMCAYNQVNGIYACENAFLLNDVLRRDWGYKGFVMSDWGSVNSLSIKQGLDQESGTRTKNKAWFRDLKQDLAAGNVAQAEIDRSATRILRSIYAFGLADHPVEPGQPIDFEANGRVAQEVAENGIVLLKNAGGLLPVAASARTILIVGGHADKGVPAGGGSSQVWPAGGAALSLSIPGDAIYHKRLYMPSSPVEALKQALPQSTIHYDDGSDAARAAAAARTADLVIVFAEQFTAEGTDVATLSLPDNQDALIASLASANAKTVVVLETGGPVLMPWLDKVGAVLAAWYPGQRGGAAIANVLTGAVNPSGRLPITFPASLDQTPNPVLPGSNLAREEGGKTIYDLPTGQKSFPVTYPEGSDVGYRWYDRTRARPLFAFGHGLSYTSFRYDSLKLSGGRELRARFRLTNSGARAGTEIAQLYTRINGVQRLAGWSRVTLKPGESRVVTIKAEPRILASFDTTRTNWHIAGGRYEVALSTAADSPVLTGSVSMTDRRIKP